MFGTKTLVALAKKRPGGTCCGQDEDRLRSVKTTSGLSAQVLTLLEKTAAARAHVATEGVVWAADLLC